MKAIVREGLEAGAVGVSSSAIAPFRLNGAAESRFEEEIRCGGRGRWGGARVIQLA
jgi:hypothetical protein